MRRRRRKYMYSHTKVCILSIPSAASSSKFLTNTHARHFSKFYRFFTVCTVHGTSLSGFGNTSIRRSYHITLSYHGMPTSREEVRRRSPGRWAHPSFQFRLILLISIKLHRNIEEPTFLCHFLWKYLGFQNVLTPFSSNLSGQHTLLFQFFLHGSK